MGFTNGGAMHLFFMVWASWSTLASASSCGVVEKGVCEEKATSVLNASVKYTRTFPKCCKPTKTDMSLKEGLLCLKEDNEFRHSFAACLKARFNESEHYNALKPADAIAKIGPDTIQYALKKKPILKRLLYDKVLPLPGTDRTYLDPFDGDMWIDPGDAMAGFGQQEFFRYAVGALPHGSRGQGVQDGQNGNAPPRNRLGSYQKEGAKYNYSAVAVWAGAGNGFNDILVLPTSTWKTANIGFFVRHHTVETIAELFKVVGEAGTNLEEKGMHMKALHTDGQDVPLLHVRLDMEQTEGVLWPASRNMSVKHQARMICVAFQSLLNAPWTLEQLNLAWKNDLQANVPHLTWRFSDFYKGFVHDNETNGPLKELLAGKWDGNCDATGSDRSSGWTLTIAQICGAAIVIVLIVKCRRPRASSADAREPLLQC